MEHRFLAHEVVVLFVAQARISSLNSRNVSSHQLTGGWCIPKSCATLLWVKPTEKAFHDASNREPSRS